MTTRIIPAPIFPSPACAPGRHHLVRIGGLLVVVATLLPALRTGLGSERVRPVARSLTQPAAQEPAPGAVRPAAPLPAGDHTRRIVVDNRERTYLVHVPDNLKPDQSVPVVLALHGAGMNGALMSWLSGLNRKSDAAGFVVVYPSGTGAGTFLTWNSGGLGDRRGEKPDDVRFISRLLDELDTLLPVDPQRVYACGMSNGAMMCYRLAAELSDRIAAIAPVAGTVAIEESRPTRAVPVLHFHGTEDTLVPYEGPRNKLPRFITFQSVDDSIATWVKLNGCQGPPQVDVLSRDGDDLKVTRSTYAGGRDESEVVLIVIEGGGHTWPGRPTPARFLGKTARNISADDLIWEFFEKHPRP